MARSINPKIPTTQTIASVQARAKSLGMVEETPEVVPLADGSKLVLSSKKDCYYTTSTEKCSCKAGQFGTLCRHRKSLLDRHKPSEAQVYQANQRARRAAASYRPIRPEPSLMSEFGVFRPVLEWIPEIFILFHDKDNME